MDYLTARWFLIKNIGEEKLKNLHSIEASAYKYAQDCKKNFKRDKVVPIIWWQAGLSSLSDNYLEFWQYCECPENLQKINYTAMLIRGILSARGITLSDIFSNITLMHQCDILILHLPFTYHTDSLSLPIPSSIVSLA